MHGPVITFVAAVWHCHLLRVHLAGGELRLVVLLQKMKIMASGPITSCQIDGETMETGQTLFLWAPKSLQMVTAAMKLKDTYSLEGEL